jgi:hypothetical protein
MATALFELCKTTLKPTSKPTTFKHKNIILLQAGKGEMILATDRDQIRAYSKSRRFTDPGIKIIVVHQPGIIAIVGR